MGRAISSDRTDRASGLFYHLHSPLSKILYMIKCTEIKAVCCSSSFFPHPTTRPARGLSPRHLKPCVNSRPPSFTRCRSATGPTEGGPKWTLNNSTYSRLSRQKTPRLVLCSVIFLKSWSTISNAYGRNCRTWGQSLNQPGHRLQLVGDLFPSLLGPRPARANCYHNGLLCTSSPM